MFHQALKEERDKEAKAKKAVRIPTI